MIRSFLNRSFRTNAETRSDPSRTRYLFQKNLFLSLFVGFSLPGKGGPVRELPLRELQKFRDQPTCTLIHPWASWCKQCLVELPMLLPKLKTLPYVQVLVIDISEPKVQKLFSIAWAESLASELALFRMPKGNEKAYRRQIDSEWTGGLPYSVLYRSGKVQSRWSGLTDFSQIELVVRKNCR